MRFLKLTIAYDGTSYVGWQVQSKGESIQGRLERAWKKVTGETKRITASGRTDAGVHALGQVCSVATESRIPETQLVRALNAYLHPLSPPEFQFQMTVEQMAESATTLFVLRDGAGAAEGMGALKVHDSEMGEVKRMYTSPKIGGKFPASLLPGSRKIQ